MFKLAGVSCFVFLVGVCAHELEGEQVSVTPDVCGGQQELGISGTEEAKAKTCESKALSY